MLRHTAHRLSSKMLSPPLRQKETSDGALAGLPLVRGDDRSRALEYVASPGPHIVLPRRP